MTFGSCFQKFNKFLLVFTTCIVASLGLSFVAMAIVGCTNTIKGATIFPPSTFPLCGVLGGTILMISILDFISIHSPRRPIIYISLALIVIVFTMQIILGVLIQQKEENPFGYMTEEWHGRGNNYRNQLQNEFQCCGYANVFDDTVLSDMCPSNNFLFRDPCFYALTNYIDNHFYKAHSFLFSTLTVDFMALLNGLTMLCLLKREQTLGSLKMDTIPLHDNVIVHSPSPDHLSLPPFKEYSSRVERFQQTQL